jgi:hypothetical protein
MHAAHDTEYEHSCHANGLKAQSPTSSILNKTASVRAAARIATLGVRICMDWLGPQFARPVALAG